MRTLDQQHIVPVRAIAKQQQHGGLTGRSVGGWKEPRQLQRIHLTRGGGYRVQPGGQRTGRHHASHRLTPRLSLTSWVSWS